MTYRDLLAQSSEAWNGVNPISLFTFLSFALDVIRKGDFEDSHGLFRDLDAAHELLRRLPKGADPHIKRATLKNYVLEDIFYALNRGKRDATRLQRAAYIIDYLEGYFDGTNVHKLLITQGYIFLKEGFSRTEAGQSTDDRPMKALFHNPDPYKALDNCLKEPDQIDVEGRLKPNGEREMPAWPLQASLFCQIFAVDRPRLIQLALSGGFDQVLRDLRKDDQRGAEKTDLPSTPYGTLRNLNWWHLAMIAVLVAGFVAFNILVPPKTSTGASGRPKLVPNSRLSEYVVDWGDVLTGPFAVMSPESSELELRLEELQGIATQKSTQVVGRGRLLVRLMVINNKSRPVLPAALVVKTGRPIAGIQTEPIEYPDNLSANPFTVEMGCRIGAIREIKILNPTRSKLEAGQGVLLSMILKLDDDCDEGLTSMDLGLRVYSNPEEDDDIVWLAQKLLLANP